MPPHKTLLRLACVATLLGLGCVLPAKAQQAIINLPSADLTPKGQVFLMNESFISPYTNQEEWKTTNFFTVGVSKTTELAITTFNAGLPRTDNFTVAYGFKSVIPLLEQRLKDRELKLTYGAMLPVSKQGRGVGHYGYTHLSGRLPKVNTRLTAGISVGSDHVFERDTVAFSGGIEHPITPELNAVLEYYSGTHAFAGGVLGLVYHNHKSDWVLVAGYRIPNNDASGNHGFIVEVGKFIGPKPQRHTQHEPHPEDQHPAPPFDPSNEPLPEDQPTEAQPSTVFSTEAPADHLSEISPDPF